MKYRDLDGQFKEITIKTSDTLPVGSVVEYDGSTPPTGWSKVSDHDGNVIVSSEEPTTGEEVWIQRGKNLFDKNTISKDCWVTSSGGESFSSGSNDYMSSYIKCKANTPYTLSGYIEVETNYLVICSYDKNYQYIEHIVAEVETTGTKTFVVNQDCYIRFAYGKGLSAIDNVQLEQGEVATSYEPYITKKIHTKTNDAYEEFYNEEEVNKEFYSTSEQRIGTYLGKPLYRKVFSGLQCPNNGIGTFTNMLKNTDKIIRLEGIFTDKTSANEHWFAIFGKAEVNGMALNFNQYSGVLYLVSSKDMSNYTCDVIFEYTKTTD